MPWFRREALRQIGCPLDRERTPATALFYRPAPRSLAKVRQCIQVEEGGTGSYSAVFYTYHAFFADPGANLFAVPLIEAHYEWNVGEPPAATFVPLFRGMKVYSTANNKLEIIRSTAYHSGGTQMGPQLGNVGLLCGSNESTSGSDNRMFKFDGRYVLASAAGGSSFDSNFANSVQKEVWGGNCNEVIGYVSSGSWQGPID